MGSGIPAPKARWHLAAGFQLKPERGWGWLLIGGIVTLALAVMIWRRWPVSGTWAIGTLFGINILFSGRGMIFSGGAMRSAVREVGKEG